MVCKVGTLPMSKVRYVSDYQLYHNHDKIRNPLLYMPTLLLAATSIEVSKLAYLPTSVTSTPNTNNRA